MTHRALCDNIAFCALAEFVEPADVSRLAQTCRLLANSLANNRVRIYAAVPPRTLGKHGDWSILKFRWQQMKIVPQRETDLACAGAAMGGQEQMIRTLITGTDLPSARAIDASLLAIMKGNVRVSCEFLKWFLLKAAPSVEIMERCFKYAAGNGKLGYVQLLWSHIRRTGSFAQDQARKQDAIEFATSQSASNAHVANWIRQYAH